MSFSLRLCAFAGYLPIIFGQMSITEANKLRLLYFLAFSCTASWLPIFADYLKERGLNGIQIGVILSITPVMMFLVQPLQGMLADRLGYKKCLIWSSLFASLSYLFYILDGIFRPEERRGGKGWIA